MDTTVQMSNILEQARKARSIKGAPIPQRLLDKLVKLEAENPTYKFILGSATSLSRKMSYFRQNHPDLSFFDKSGEEFEFNDYAPAVMLNEPFMGINFGRNTNEAYIFMYFPFDGAIR